MVQVLCDDAECVNAGHRSSPLCVAKQHSLIIVLGRFDHSVLRLIVSSNLIRITYFFLCARFHSILLLVTQHMFDISNTDVTQQHLQIKCVGSSLILIICVSSVSVSQTLEQSDTPRWELHRKKIISVQPRIQ